VPNDIGTAHDTAYYASNHRAGRTGNDGTRARADRNAFQRSGLRHDWHRCQHQHKQSALERRMHEKSPWLTSIAVNRNRRFHNINMAVHEVFLSVYLTNVRIQ
jgi:hypothetical protein